MNVSYMIKNWATKSAITLVFGLCLGVVSNAMGQLAGDITSVKVTSHGKGQTVTAPGDEIEFIIRLGQTNKPGQRFLLHSEVPGADNSPLSLKMSTGGYAICKGSSHPAGAEHRTDLHFTYKVKEGDLALPLKIFCVAGSGSSGLPYQFLNDDIWTVEETTSHRKVIWSLADGGYSSDDVKDWDMVKSNVRIQTLQFDQLNYSVPATERLGCTVSRTGNDTTLPVDFYLWSGNRDVFTVEGEEATQKLHVSIPSGEKSATFYIWGVKANSSDFLYLGQTAEQNPENENWVKRPVKVTEAPQPTIKVVINGANDANTLTTIELDETIPTTEKTHTLFVQLTQPAPEDIDINLTADPNYIKLSNNKVRIIKGAVKSDAVSFWALDNTTSTVITPSAVTDFYKIFKPGMVTILNVSPKIVLPTEEDKLDVKTGREYSMDYQIIDVEKDIPKLQTTVNWGDDSEPTTINGSAAGKLTHTWLQSGSYPVKITTIDTDTGSHEIKFNVIVKDPAKKPTLDVVFDNPAAMDESEANKKRNFCVKASKAYPGTEPISVKIMMKFPDDTVKNLLSYQFEHEIPIVIPNNAELTSAQFPIEVVDGTIRSGSEGVYIWAVPTDPQVAQYYDSPKTVMMVNNMKPIAEVPNNSEFDPAYTNEVPAGVLRKLPYRFTDPSKSDLSLLVSEWDFFNDGTIDMTVTGAQGTVEFMFPEKGNWPVRVYLSDKDSRDDKVIIDTDVYVCDEPSIWIEASSYTIDETLFAPDKSLLKHDDYITVCIKPAVKYPVPIDLLVKPTSDRNNGTLTLVSQKTSIDSGKTEVLVRISEIMDGTSKSFDTGFEITPKIQEGTPTTDLAKGYFKKFIPVTINIANKDPEFVYPQEPVDSEKIWREVTQNQVATFTWSVQDSEADKNEMHVTWNWNDGSYPDERIGATGTITHTFKSFGEYYVMVTAKDKDGGSKTITLKVSVGVGQTVYATPLGPNTSSKYHGLSYPKDSLGKGKIVSSDAAGGRGEYVNEVWRFAYPANKVTASLEAIPDPISDPESEFNNFFYAWDDFSEAGETNDKGDSAGPLKALINPTTTDPICIYPFQPSATGITYQVRAVFSREWHILDNVGDLNQDGIPDNYKYWNEIITAVTGEDPKADVSLYATTDLSKTNPDGDVFPYFDRYGRITVSNKNCQAFTTLMEIRGLHMGLNDWASGRGEDGIATDGPLDEPGATTDEQTYGTNPTLSDTDGDGLPDGYEYYFWYCAKISKNFNPNRPAEEVEPDNLLTGHAFNSKNPGESILIDEGAIVNAFNPLKPAISGQDTDKDGLTDLEEFLLETNPVEWDTDNDGLPDGWEVAMGTDPLSPDDFDQASNPDGDWMAYSVEKMQFVTITADGETTHYFAEGAEEGTQNGKFWSYYTYNKEFKDLAKTEKADPVYALGAEVKAEDIFPSPEITVFSIEEKDVVLMHFQVYQKYGFDPRVAWGKGFPPDVRTKPFTTFDEFMLCKFMMNVVKVKDEFTKNDYTTLTTDPGTPDSDAVFRNGRQYYDGMPDGWELYVGCGPVGTDFQISPWNCDDGIGLYGKRSVDSEGDGLSNEREFGGSISSAAYADPGCYHSLFNTNLINFVSIKRPAEDIHWNNKFWPTDPWDEDTDGDGIKDVAETAEKLTYRGPDGTATVVTWQYSTSSNAVPYVIRGGGLNPCSVDTDRDGLPDFWEMKYTGTNAVSSVTKNPYIEMGMDGTHGPANAPKPVDPAIGMGDAYSWTDPWVMGDNRTRREMDFDNDGLENYQEYMVHAMRHFRYDIPAEGEDSIPMEGFLVEDLFNKVPHEWDPAAKLIMNPGRELKFLLPSAVSGGYGSTDPRNPDTDHDGMDDFYELFHGLNPILGTVDLLEGTNDDGDPVNAFMNSFGGTLDKPLSMDFQKYPWLAGLITADPDGDGLLNLEEMILLNSPTPEDSNTDPSPLWMTDKSYSNSWVNLYYRPMKAFYWSPFEATEDFYLYSFEMNEGYDTDNDGISDKNELILGSMAETDPRDFDDPLRRQALWFSGTNSVAESLVQSLEDQYTFRTFTVELWARPEVNDREQVLIERPVIYPDSDLSTTGGTIRVNFRIGIKEDGRYYAMYQSAGVHDEQTGVMIAYGPKATTNVWTHLAAKLDGQAGVFTLYVNGLPVQNVLSSLVPANGVLDTIYIPVESKPAETNSTTGRASRKFSCIEGVPVVPGRIVLGASDITMDMFRETPAWTNFVNFYQGYIDEVRIWDGWRTDAEIYKNFRKRFLRKDLLENRANVALRKKMHASRLPNTENLLPAELLYNYNFDNLFSADVETSVATAPRGFMDPSVQINRPADYTVTWWDEMETKSTVYTNYSYLPWIENGLAHLAPLDGTVVDSRLFGLQYSGIEPVEADGTDIIWQFPVGCNPYGLWYNNDVADSRAVLNSKKGAVVNKKDNPELSQMKADNYQIISTSDLLPMGAAWAKFVPEMWDNGTAGSVWAETGTDSDSDGLPDWWEEYVATLYPGMEFDWDDIYPDGKGMTVGHRYMRDIANGWTETKHPGVPGFDPTQLVKQTSDADGDDLPDWWENLWGLKSNSAEGDNGKYGDPDKDGLSNYSEFLITEVYGFANLSPVQFKSNPNQIDSDYFIKCGKSYLGAFFSDHDFIDDVWEDLYSIDAVSRHAYDAWMDYDDDGWSNWAECRYGTGIRRTNPMLTSRTGVSANKPVDKKEDGAGGATGDNKGAFGKVMEVPIPTLKVNVQYSGANKNGPLVVEAWTDPEMNGIPDAHYTVPSDGAAVSKQKNVGFWDSETPIKVQLSPGAIVPGSVEFSMVSQGADPSKDDELSENVNKTRNTIFAKDLVYLPEDMGEIYAVDNKKLQTDFKLGTVDYKTGKVTVDLSILNGVSYITSGTNSTAVSDPRKSYIFVKYSSMFTEDYPRTVYLTDADPSGENAKSRGYIREGMNYIHAFIDNNGDGKWSVGEPYGVAEQFGIDINWHSQEINIELTDLAKEQFRFDTATLSRSEDVLVQDHTGGAAGGGAGAGGEEGGGLSKETTVHVLRTYAGTSSQYPRIVFSKTLVGRTTITEADMLAKGLWGFDWALAGIPTNVDPDYMVYEVYVGNYTESDIIRKFNSSDTGSGSSSDGYGESNDKGIQPSYVFTNYVMKASHMPTAKIVEPMDNYQYRARPVFKWTMPEECPAFALEIAKMNRGKVETVWKIDAAKAPVRTTDKVYVWRAPVSVGSVLVPHTVYQWRVAGLSANTPNARKWSDWQKFRMDTAAPAPSAGYGEIKASVKYYGALSEADLKGKVKVCAYLTAGFTGEPEAEFHMNTDEIRAMLSTNSKSINATLIGLTPSKTVGSYYLMAYVDQNGNGKRDPWESWGYANRYGEITMGYDPREIEVTEYSHMPGVNIVIEDVDTDQDWYPDAWEYASANGSKDFLTKVGPNSSNIADTEINPDLVVGEMTSSRVSTMALFFEVKESANGLPFFVQSASPDYPNDSLKITGFTLGEDGKPTITVQATRPGVQIMGTSEKVKVQIEYTESLSNPDWKVLGESEISVGGNSTVKAQGEVPSKTGFYRLRKIENLK